MKKVINLFKNNKNIIFAFILILIAMIGTVYAATIIYQSSEVKYNNDSSGLESDNVQDAIDELYDNCVGTVATGQIWTFLYTGSTQRWVAPTTGTYKLDVWGAQGGDGTYGGKGGYSSGNISLNKNDVLYVVVGGQGKCASGTSAGGYNGGGNSSSAGGDTRYRCSGGGATHIGKTDSPLSGSKTEYTYIVAGGGGGRGEGGSAAGAGGGTSGTSGNGGGTGGGGSFGQGGTSTSLLGAGGGGGGLSGGGSGTHYLGGGGGSGYIGGVTSGTTKAGNTSFVSPTGSNETGHAGNGYARITYLGA